MKVEKHGRSFLVKNSEKEEYIPKILPRNVEKPTKSEVEKQIAGLHRSGQCSIKELALTFGIAEDKVEKIITIDMNNRKYEWKYMSEEEREKELNGLPKKWNPDLMY